MSAEVFTVKEVADYLRTDSATVERMLEEGKLSGFKVEGEWRILGLALVEFLKQASAKSRMDVLAQNFLDPRAWLRVIPEGDYAFFKEGEWPEGSFGAMIREAILTDERERDAGNVVPLDPRPRGA
jgi:excisionase family DNA binding protein